MIAQSLNPRSVCYLKLARWIQAMKGKQSLLLSASMKCDKHASLFLIFIICKNKNASRPAWTWYLCHLVTVCTLRKEAVPGRHGLHPESTSIIQHAAQEGA